MAANHDNPIGGYFELELPAVEQRLYPDALRFQSARAAFAGLLQTGKPARVWMPRFICDCMLSPLRGTNIEIAFYGVTEQFGVPAEIELLDEDWLLYVNYFGICGEQEYDLLARFNPVQLVFDHSQAFYSSPPGGMATIYSPRKFFGVPDGGLLITDLPVQEPTEIDPGSVARCAHLLTRLNGGPESGYQQFLRDEATLDDSRPLRMSSLTESLLRRVDYATARQQRTANFEALHANLGRFNRLCIELTDCAGALCYPFLCPESLPASKARTKLLSKRVFVATYWPEVISRADPGSFEHQLIEYLLPIPCDQRYVPADLTRITEQVRSMINHDESNSSPRVGFSDRSYGAPR